MIRQYLKKVHKVNAYYFLLLIPIVIVDVCLSFSWIVFPKFFFDSLEINKSQLTPYLYILLFVISLLVFNGMSNVLNARKNIAIYKVKNSFLSDLSECVMSIEYELLENNDNQIKISQAIDAIEGTSNWTLKRLNGVKGIDAIGSEMITIILSLVKISGVIYILYELQLSIIVLTFVIVIFNALSNSWKKRVEFKLRFNTAKYVQQANYFIGTMLNSQNGKEIRQNKMQKHLLESAKAYRMKFVNERFVKNKSVLYADIFSLSTITMQNGFVYIFLSYQFIRGDITIGSFIMYITSIELFSRFLNALIESVLNINLYATYLKDFFDLLDLDKPVVSDSNESNLITDATPQKIVFENVWFKYPNGEDYVLKNINITINPYEKLGVVGMNGAGKTTFIKLILGLYKPDRGRILYGDREIQSFNFTEYTKCIGAIFQDFKMFNFSLKENIAFDNHLDEKIEHYARQLDFYSKIQSLPKGLETTFSKEFDPEGIMLSSGEQQKLAILRVLNKNTPIIILDEPTAALDAITEYNLYRSYDELMKNKTSIYISHRLASARFCDVVAVFSKGEIVEYGSHNELVNNNNLYTEMFNKQAEYYKDVEGYL